MANGDPLSPCHGLHVRQGCLLRRCKCWFTARRTPPVLYYEPLDDVESMSLLITLHELILTDCAVGQLLLFLVSRQPHFTGFAN